MKKWIKIFFTQIRFLFSKNSRVCKHGLCLCLVIPCARINKRLSSVNKPSADYRDKNTKILTKSMSKTFNITAKANDESIQGACRKKKELNIFVTCIKAFFPIESVKHVDSWATQHENEKCRCLLKIHLCVLF